MEAVAGMFKEIGSSMSCRIIGCTRYPHARGLCTMHYNRVRLTGDSGPAAPIKRRPGAKGCTVVGCPREHSMAGYCSMHWKRVERHGDAGQAEPILNYSVYRKLTVNGYIEVWAPEHPLAMSTGYVLEHRKVVYDSGTPIPDGWQVHHLNSVKTDNRRENLEVVDPAEHTRQHAQENGYIRNQFGEWPLRDLVRGNP